MSGYPVIDDPTHPLWEESQAGWPTLAPHEAMTKAVEHMAKGQANSKTHPSFAVGAIVNAYATRPDEDKADIVYKERR